jgi:hypothetical protein
MKTDPTEHAVRSVEEMVAAFGGTKAMADWADVGMSAVSNWIASKAIPRGYHLRLYLEAQRRGILVHPDLFGALPKQDGKPRPSMEVNAA